MARQFAHDDDVTGFEVGYDDLGNIRFGPAAIDRPVQHHRRDHASDAQTGDQYGRLAMAGREPIRGRSPLPYRS